MNLLPTNDVPEKRERVDDRCSVSQGLTVLLFLVQLYVLLQNLAPTPVQYLLDQGKGFDVMTTLVMTSIKSSFARSSSLARIL